MKDKLIYIRGFSTLEVLVAFMVIILSLTSMVSLVFSGQSLVVDSENSSNAVRKAQALLEVAHAQSFLTLNSLPEASNGIYQESLNIQELDDYTKQATAKLIWQSEGRNHNLEISTIVTDPASAVGGDSCSQTVSGNWQHPQIINFNLAQLAGVTGSYDISGLDIYQNKLYVVANNTSAKTDPVFFVFDVASSTQPVLISSIDNDSRVIAGPAAVKVVSKYAFLASASSYSRGQLQVIDLAANPPSVVVTYKLPIINSSGSAKGLGSSIFYRNNYIYLGLTKSDSENELNILDVSDPENPVFKGSYKIGNAINAIYVRGDHAYLAHPTDAGASPQEQLTVLDISDPTSPKRINGFYFNGSSGGNGKSLYGTAGKLYFGRTASKISGSSADFIPEFFAFNNSPSFSPSILAGLSLNTPQSLNGLIVRSNLAYFLTSNYFQIWDLSNPASITAWASPLSLPGNGSALDCEGNIFYVASVDNSGVGYLSVIFPGP